MPDDGGDAAEAVPYCSVALEEGGSTLARLLHQPGFLYLALGHCCHSQHRRLQLQRLSSTDESPATFSPD
jgi:hypothetical protein